MKFQSLAACALAALALSACSTPDTRFVRDEPAAPVSGFVPVATTPSPSNFCQGVAASDRLRAELAGFDIATLDRIALQSLQQCRTLLAGSFDAKLEQLASR